MSGDLKEAHDAATAGGGTCVEVVASGHVFQGKVGIVKAIDLYGVLEMESSNGTLFWANTMDVRIVQPS